MYVCMHIDLTQMTMRPQQHRHRVSAVHLAGSCGLTRVHMELGGSGRQHSSNVLTHALITPVVLLLTGLINIANAGYITGILNIMREPVSHSLKSPNDVI